MFELGIRVVRIGEFAWQQLEPNSGELHLDWLHQAIDTLQRAGLSIVLGTPTATPPKWLVDKYPDILAVDYKGQTRGFGSRRHYCFSSVRYQQECARIVEILANEFGRHSALLAWQTDNEYGCHNTTLSYSANALAAFRSWCENEYGSIETLNRAWGNAFWSMALANFNEVELPLLTVTEANPAHQLAFWRFSSVQVRAFNRLQTNLIRQYSERPISHNFMGNFVEFDHREVAKDLDIATWDSYPLGFLDRDDGRVVDDNGAGNLESAENNENRDNPGVKDPLLSWYRTGHPDTAAFHHDLYRGMCQGRWWVMEQQPGPVNWAPHNPSPLPGMVRLWGMEAFAHGAEVVSYFRWRQSPVAQEQMHAGLLLSDGTPDVAAGEVQQLAREIGQLSSTSTSTATTGVPTEEQGHAVAGPADVALIFDYAADAALRIQKPGGDSGLHGAMGGRFDPLGWTQAAYTALRECGQSVDIIGSGADLRAYQLIVVACCGISDSLLAKKLKDSTATILLLPRSGSKTGNCEIPPQLPPGELQALLPIRVVRSESLPPAITLRATLSDHPQSKDQLLPLQTGSSNGRQMQCCDWREKIETELPSSGSFDDGWGFHYQSGKIHYLNAWLTARSLKAFIRELIIESALNPVDCPAGLRLRTLRTGERSPRRIADSPDEWPSYGELHFACNYGPDTVNLLALNGLTKLHKDALQHNLLLGNVTLKPADVAVWVV